MDSVKLTVVTNGALPTKENDVSLEILHIIALLCSNVAVDKSFGPNREDQILSCTGRYIKCVNKEARDLGGIIGKDYVGGLEVCIRKST